MSTTPTAVGGFLARVLDRAETALNDYGITLPENRRVTHGEPAWDCCDQLAVWAQLIKPATKFPFQETRELRAVRFALDVGVQITRCVPVILDGGFLPTNAELSASAFALAADAWTIYHELACQAVDGTLVADCECDNAALGNVRPVGPTGGCAGYQFAVSVELSGVT